MTREIYVISDTHFGHSNVIEYGRRPFSSCAEMDDFMVTAWNETVRDQDIVYHLGDVYFHNGFEALPKLKGRKRLVLGNHDDPKDKYLYSSFQQISAWRMFPEFGILLTHVPVHESALRVKNLINVHGHIHQRSLMDPRYACVSVEHTDYRPINIDELRKDQL